MRLGVCHACHRNVSRKKQQLSKKQTVGSNSLHFMSRSMSSVSRKHVTKTQKKQWSAPFPYLLQLKNIHICEAVIGHRDTKTKVLSSKIYAKTYPNSFKTDRDAQRETFKNDSVFSWMMHVGVLHLLFKVDTTCSGQLTGGGTPPR